MYPSLLQLFIDADTNKDGLVIKASFFKLFDAAETLSRIYEYAPADFKLYQTEAEDAARQNSVRLNGSEIHWNHEWRMVEIHKGILHFNYMYVHEEVSRFRIFFKSTSEYYRIFWKHTFPSCRFKL